LAIAALLCLWAAAPSRAWGTGPAASGWHDLARQAALRDGLPAPLGSAVIDLPCERQLLSWARGGTLDRGRLFWAALVASGAHDPNELARYQLRFEEWVSDLRQRLAQLAADVPRSRAEATYAFLHDEILTGSYDLNCSNLTEAIDTGRFNCISATILFNSLAAEVGLLSQAVESPGHVVSRLHLPERTLTIETTCPHWFQIMDDPRRRHFIPPVGGRAVASRGPGAPAGTRVIDAAGQAAILYYNRGVDEVERGRYPQAVAMNLKALRLDPHNQNAWGNLLASINNWALEQSQRNDYAGALEILAAGRQVAPGHETFELNEVALYRQWIEHLSAAGQHDQAAAVLQQGLRHAARPASLRRLATAMPEP
jgi:tetratricopeptide (TPR) repeat protein